MQHFCKKKVINKIKLKLLITFSIFVWNNQNKIYFTLYIYMCMRVICTTM